jgi:hypothetical protein
MTRAGGFRRGRKAVSAMQLDPVKYRHYFDCFDMDEDEKLLFMRQLWAIMESFVTRTFHEKSDAISLGIDRMKRDQIAKDRLDSDDIFSSTFNDAASETAAGKTRTTCPESTPDALA